jgi:hypothetical protein
VNGFSLLIRPRFGILKKRWIPLKADGNEEWSRFLPETRRNDIMKDGFPVTTVGNDPCGFYGCAVS